MTWHIKTEKTTTYTSYDILPEEREQKVWLLTDKGVFEGRFYNAAWDWSQTHYEFEITEDKDKYLRPGHNIPYPAYESREILGWLPFSEDRPSYKDK